MREGTLLADGNSSGVTVGVGDEVAEGVGEPKLAELVALRLRVGDGAIV